ncbi:MAG: hypothetical protein ABI461_14215, partial [Polyangiaceae bacterium]
MNRGAFALAPALVVLTTALADARVPQPAAKSWAGLDAPAASSTPRDIVVLRAPAQGKVRLAGGSFIMGSTPPE